MKKTILAAALAALIAAPAFAIPDGHRGQAATNASQGAGNKYGGGPSASQGGNGPGGGRYYDARTAATHKAWGGWTPAPTGAR